ncbi:MerR family transcriptional regulator [Cohnella phaseoli]|uniref:DNA-binding transcriptional MerR regulator n=1 Tax=Cohnella phaseoli TaxID=456490 RepID=A0A3D9IU04_9BACL|nr:MerR family transcriptional regulator [Cohnella phaseoli]RED65251.1 DNA-binding transcriptional MerR regulator [Cohnella phaseoli]
MEYTVQKLGQLAGISTRTLRYYDEIGLLKPARINSSGYRIYGQWEVDRLQQILFYRELDVGLDEIKAIVDSPEFDARRALSRHREQLLAKRRQLDALIANIDLTLAYQKGMTDMSDKQKFEGFKQQLIDDNEAKYGEEIRAKYGDEQVDKSNAKLKGMTKEQYKEIERLSEDIHATLAQAFATGDPAGELAQKAADLHRRWLTFYWDRYSKEAHAGIAQMYVEDERFKAYYDKDQPGVAEFLREAIRIYTGIDA